MFGFEIKSYSDMIKALSIEYFDNNGGYICDHGLYQIPFELASEQEIELILKKHYQRKIN